MAAPRLSRPSRPKRYPLLRGLRDGGLCAFGGCFSDGIGDGTCRFPCAIENRGHSEESPLTLSGSVRARYETISGHPRAGFSDSDDLFNLRTIVTTQYDAGLVRFGAELYDSRVYGSDAGTPVTTNEVNTLELVQAYVSTTIDAPFGMRRAELAPAGLYNAIGRTNILTPAIRFESTTSKRFDRFANYRLLWLASRTDNLSTTGVRDAGGNSGRFGGHQLEACGRYWLIPKTLRAEANGLLLFKGRFLDTAPNAPQTGNTRYLSLNLTANF